MDIRWNDDKNTLLKQTRAISFEEVVEAIRDDKIFKDIQHPDQVKYSGQRIIFVEIKRYIYAVPYVTTTDHIFLKTIYPSRKINKLYWEQNHER